MMDKSLIRETLCDERPESLEALARRARRLTEQHFGRTISLYAPLYLSNYCSSHCTYCGFSVHNTIRRKKLGPAEIEQEMRSVASSGIQNILLLTGESYKATPLSYLKEAVMIARRYFPSISLEVHPMEGPEYRELFVCGADGVTVYQETYDRQRYAQVHLLGKKKDYDFRLDAPRRAAEAGMRYLSLGVLLGLSDVCEDITALYEHLRFLEKRYPGVEYSVSFPRLRPIKGMGFVPCRVDDRMLIRLICLTRVLFPRVGINLSTRESAFLRDHALGLGVTRLSAASRTSVGGYTLLDKESREPQFDIQDERSVAQIVQLLKTRRYDPVFTDWRHISNGAAAA